MAIFTTPSFTRSTKRLRPKEIAELEKHLRLIAAQPQLGAQKVEDLKGVWVYKFQIASDEYLLAYQLLNGSDLKLLLLGRHENFYLTLKRKI